MRKVLSFYCEDCNENFETKFPDYGEEYFKLVEGKWKAACPHCGKTCISDKFINIPDKE